MVELNPLGYYCAPNMCDPHYATEHDFKRFVGFGLFVCYEMLKGQGSELIQSTDDDVIDLRRQFLAEVDLAIQWANAGESGPYQGDHHPGRYIGNLYFQWMFERLDEDGALLFVLDWGEDEFTCWLSTSALTDNYKEVLERAREVNK